MEIGPNKLATLYIIRMTSPGRGGASSWLDKSCRCSSVMSRTAGMWKRRVNVWGLLGAKMLSNAMRQYRRARALSQRSSSLKHTNAQVLNVTGICCLTLSPPAFLKKVANQRFCRFSLKWNNNIWNMQYIKIKIKHSTFKQNNQFYSSFKHF